MLRSATYSGIYGVCELMLRDVSYSNATAPECDVFGDVQCHRMASMALGMSAVWRLWDVTRGNVVKCGS